MKFVVICGISSLLSCISPFEAKGASAHRALPTRVQYGVASWYGEQNQGRLMASGLPFDEHEMVAAHRTLPLGTQVEVTNLKNGRSVIVRIMDRGPHRAGRIIDLSKAAASRLHFTRRGLAKVRLVVLSTPGPQPREGGRRNRVSCDRRHLAPPHPVHSRPTLVAWSGRRTPWAAQ